MVPVLHGIAHGSRRAHGGPTGTISLFAKLFKGKGKEPKRLEDNLVVGSVGFDTRDGFQASKHFDNDARRQRAAQKRALFLQQEISEEGPRSCSPPPSPPLPPPNTVPDPPPIHQDEPQNNKPWISKSSSGIQERVRLLEQNLAATDRAKSLEPEEWGTNHNSVRGPGSASPIHRSENSSTGPRIDSPASRRDIAVSPDRRVLIDQKDLVPAVAKRKVSRVHKAKSFLHRAITGARRLPESESQEINMAGVPPPPSSGVDMGLLQNLLQKASEDVQLQNASNDEAWKGTLNGVGVKIYAPHSSQQMRQTCGVSWDMLAESFLDTATTAAGAGGHRRLGTVKKRGVFSREEDQILLAPAGPYVAKTISAQECKYLAKVASRYVEHFQDCQNSLLPRCYVIMRIAKGGRVKSTEHWVVTDNLNDLPLPVRLTYDLKGVYSRVTKVASGNEPMVVLKEGNLPQSNKIQSLPQVSPWGTRQLLLALSVDCAVLEELKATNYSLLVLVCPARGEVDEMTYIGRSPRRPPYVRLDGQDCTLFAVLVDCLQEWAPAKVVTRLLTFFKGPTKAVEAFGLAPNRYSARLHGYVEQALGENKKREEYSSQKWSDAVRTKAAVNLTPQALPGDSLSPVASESPETYGSIRPLSHALTNKEIELQKKRLAQVRRTQSAASPGPEANVSPILTHAPTWHISPTSDSIEPSPPDVESSGWDYPRQRPLSLVPSTLPTASSPRTDSSAPADGSPAVASRWSEPASKAASSATGGIFTTADSPGAAQQPGPNISTASTANSAADPRGRPSWAVKAAGTTADSLRPAGSPAALRLSSASPSSLKSSLRPTNGASPAGSPATGGDAKAEEERKRRAEEKRALFLQQQASNQER